MMVKDWSKPIEIVDGERVIPARVMGSVSFGSMSFDVYANDMHWYANADGTIPATGLIVRNVVEQPNEASDQITFDDRPVTDYVATLREITEGVKEVEAILAHDGAGYFSLIRQWAEDRNLIAGSTPDKQMLKLVEEFGELGAAMARGRMDDAKDAIGDMIVVLTILSATMGFTVEECIAGAWDEIKDRRGVMRDGVFIREETPA